MFMVRARNVSIALKRYHHCKDYQSFKMQIFGEQNFKCIHIYTAIFTLGKLYIIGMYYFSVVTDLYSYVKLLLSFLIFI